MYLFQESVLGSIKAMKRRVRNIATKANISPSSTRAKLDSFTLSCAITYHLIFEELKSSSTVHVLLDVFPRFQEDFRASGGNLARMPDQLEIMCLESMCRAASYTTHSAVIGARAALALPSVDSLDRVETNCDIDVTILGLSRIPLYNVLLQRFTDHMDTLTSQLLNLPIPTAVEKLECLWCVWGATDAFGVQAPAKELEMARSVLPRIRILLSEMPCTDSERASLETVLGGMQELERRNCLLLGVTRDPPRLQAEQLDITNLYSFTSEDLDWILAYRPLGAPIKRDGVSKRTISFPLYGRWMAPLDGYIASLAIQSEVNAKKYTLSIVADLCWDTCRSVFNYTDLELAKIKDDTRYRGSIYRDCCVTILRSIIHLEPTNMSQLLVYEGLVEGTAKYSHRATIILNRLSDRCKDMRNLMVHADTSRSYLETLWSIVKVVNLVKLPVLKMWCAEFPRQAKILLRAIRTSGFSFPTSAELRSAMESAFLRESSTSSEDTITDTRPKRMVERVLTDIKAGVVVEKTLLAISADTMVDAALEELVHSLSCVCCYGTLCTSK